MASSKSGLRYGRLAFSLTCLLAACIAPIGCIVANRTTPDKPLAASPPVPPIPAAPRLPPVPDVAALAQDELATQFTAKFAPFLQSYCIECHSGAEPVGDLDLDVADMKDMALRSSKLLKMVTRLSHRQMPPASAGHDPSMEDRTAAIAWIKGFAAAQMSANAGDPGPVLAHRLSNAQYNYTIKDLTGVDIRPAREFPTDPANQAGFDNSGESLMMDPELLKKYLQAAREVSEYLVLVSDGIAFAPHPALAITDRDKFTVNRIMAFYNRQPTDLAAYLIAASHLDQQKDAGATLDSIAAAEKVSPKFLKRLYGALTDASTEKFGPLAGLTAWWRTIRQAPNPEEEQALARAIADWIHALRAATRPTIPNMTIPTVDNGSQPLVIWKVKQIEATRYGYRPGSSLDMAAFLYVADTPAATAMRPGDSVTAIDYEKTFEKFAAIFPDEFVVTERAPVYLNPNSGEGRLKGHLLNAGLHSQTGYYRDDKPLCDLILTEQDKKELDGLWADLDTVADAPLRQLQSMIWFERSDSKLMVGPAFNFIRTEDTDMGEEPKFSRLRDTFLQELPARTSPAAREAVADYFDYMQAQFKETERNRLKGESVQLDSMIAFIERALRRPLTDSEKQEERSYYTSLRTQEGLSIEEAFREVLVAGLMSPNFCYQFVAQPSAVASEPLTDNELASRLSYFLWSSMPDDALRAAAAKGDLRKPDVLRAQAHRMLKDDRIVNFATEFGGNWLDFRQFQTYNGVDRERFPTFDNALRESMYQEPIHFLTHVFRTDAPVLDLLYGDYTFVNAPLAKHYGMQVDVKGNDWVRVDKANAQQRGGILPMAVFLTQNAPGLRTSPVKRGYWVVRRVLGEEIPAPPPNVPALPTDESKMELSLPQTLARHRSDPNCATCHVRFDAMGLVFEGFGPTGQSRKTDMAGKPVEDLAVFPNDASGQGIDGLVKYIKQDRQNDFVDNLCRKLLANALGRTLLLSDELLVSQMRQNLERNDYKFSALIDTVISSPQFLNKRKGALVKG